MTVARPDTSSPSLSLSPSLSSSTVRVHAVWCCPQCRGPLVLRDADSLACAPCAATYPVIDGIADLRIDAPAWIDLDADRAYARTIAARLRAGRADAGSSGAGPRAPSPRPRCARSWRPASAAPTR